ncbi:MAG: bluetail domain-containing putative surface protein [Cyanobacteriota bacterium]|nr:bluetail domain-containing putative surface protein [Cyanobacteriota bacterium]
MPATTTPFPRAHGLLELVLPQWRALLQGWAVDGSISRAAHLAFRLDGDPSVLKGVVGAWEGGNFSGLPPIELLPAESIPGAAGAYAFSTGTIYLNADWLATATPEQVVAVLTEELGHHLDGLLNAVDTPGDEGELFAALLQGNGVIGAQKLQRLLTENDHGSVEANGQVLEVEQATVTSTPIRVAFPGRTNGEFRNGGAFAALRGDGSVVTWGGGNDGGDSSTVAARLASGVSQIFSNPSAFAALKADGSVVTWGYQSPSSNISPDATRLSSGVIQISSTEVAFAALKANGSVVTWGSPNFGGDSSAVAARLASGVTQIFSHGDAFAALKGDGSVVTWGNPSGFFTISPNVSALASGVIKIFSTYSAFAALKADGSVSTWGGDGSGGDSRAVAARLTSGVTDIFSCFGAFAALKSDGSVVTWGDPSRGGNSSAVADRLASGVTKIFSTGFAFAALKGDGSVVTWGDSDTGGNSSAVAPRLASGVTQIFSTGQAFAALKDDGSVVTWGNSSWGGNSGAVADRLASGVTRIFSSTGAFAALKGDGSVVTWGDVSYGGASSAVAARLASGVTQIFANSFAFAALKADGTVVTWGSAASGGDSSAVANKLTNVVGFANPFTDDRLVTFDPPSPTPTPPPSDPTTPWITALAGVNWSTVTSAALLGALPKSATNQFSISLPRLSQPSSYTLVFTGQNMQIKNIFNPSASSSWGGTVSKLELKQGATVVASAAIRSTALSEIAQKILADLGDASPGLGRPTVEFLQQRLNVSLPSFAIAPLAANRGEGYSGPTPFTFTVSRLGNSAAAGSVRWRAAGSGSKPTDGADFSGVTSGTLSFAAGQSSRILTINAAGDLRQENDETFSVTLSSPTGGILGSTAVAAATIRNDDFIGDGNPNTLRGGNLPDWIDGRAGADTLTGGAAGDRFGFSFGHSSIPAPDRITDFQIGVDKIDLITASGGALPPPTALTRAANNSTAPTLSALAVSVFLDANGAVAGNQPLAANRATLVVATNPVIAGTYLFINDGNAARSNSNDLLINISGHSGALPGLGVIPVGSFFL